ncbi:hypothetical protein WOLCODRAFT_80744, partial [Wolfiporia cocos MD-104 SS10]
DLPKSVQVNALINSGAMSSLIHSKLVAQHQIQMKPLRNPITIKNMNRTVNKDGDTNLPDFTLSIQYGEKRCKVLFLIGNIGNEDMILRYNWLKKENPIINWAKGKVDVTLTASVEKIQDANAKIHLDTVEMTVTPKGKLPT